MAEGFGRTRFPDTFNVFSAGVRPIGVDERAMIVMDELDIDISDQSSDSIESVPNDPDRAVVMSDPAARLAARHVDDAVQMVRWTIHDPYGARGSREEQLKEFREVRDTIQEKLSKKWPSYFD